MQNLNNCFLPKFFSLTLILIIITIFISEIGDKRCEFNFQCEPGYRCDKVSNTCKGKPFILNQFLTLIAIFLY